MQLEPTILRTQGALEAPVLIIGFNRPETFQQVFNQVRKVSPKHLYLAVNGIREGHPEDKEKVFAVRNIAKQVDWDCGLHTLFREDNHGAGFGVSGAISWAFESCDKLIILEDDCVPDTSFFYFSEAMLDIYENDSRVWSVSGRMNPVVKDMFKDQDYYFSNYGHNWGWATWKRCWKEFDMYMSDYPTFRDSKAIKSIYNTKCERTYYQKQFESIFKNINTVVNHTWDYQWSYAVRKNRGYNIIPRVNMIQNIGVNGTHGSEETQLHKREAQGMPNIIRHPRFVLHDAEFDSVYYYNIRKTLDPFLWQKVLMRLHLYHNN